MRISLSVLLCLFLSLPAVAAVSYTCDLEQGMNYAAGNSRPVGYITTLQVGTQSLKSDLNGKDPVTKANLVVIGVLKRMLWSGAGGDPKQFVFNVSAANKTLITSLLRDPALGGKDVRVSYLIYDYDVTRTRYFNAVRPKSAYLQARFIISGGRVEMGVNAEQDLTVPQPQNYEAFLGLNPARVEQAVLHTPSWGQTPTPRPWVHSGP